MAGGKILKHWIQDDLYDWINEKLTVLLRTVPQGRRWSILQIIFSLSIINSLNFEWHLD
jgi:hypothetical protein